MNYEIELLNSIIETNDWPKVLELNIQNLFLTHRDIFEYVCEHYGKYSSLPTKTILREKFNDFEALNVSSQPFEYYLDEARMHVMAQDVRNNLAKAVEILREHGPQAATNWLQTATNKILKESGTLKDTNLASDWLDRVREYRDRAGRENDVLGIPSGIKTIDEIFGGWQPGDFIVLMGWTGAKKTFLGMLFAVNAWLSGYRPLIISLEMNKYQMGYRLDTLLNAGKHFTSEDLTHARDLAVDDYQTWAENTFADKHPFYLVTAEGLDSATQNTVQAKVEQYQPDLVILDYHGLFEDAERGGTETEKAKNLSKAFKRIALKYNVPIIDIAAVTLSGSSSEKRNLENRPPELYEVAWSKQLAYDADMVLSIHSPRGSNISQVVTRKVRRCPHFAFYLDWDVNRGTWQEKYTDHDALEFA